MNGVLGPLIVKEKQAVHEVNGEIEGSLKCCSNCQYSFARLFLNFP